MGLLPGAQGSHSQHKEGLPTAEPLLGDPAPSCLTSLDVKTTPSSRLSPGLSPLPRNPCGCPAGVAPSPFPTVLLVSPSAGELLDSQRLRAASAVQAVGRAESMRALAHACLVSCLGQLGKQVHIPPGLLTSCVALGNSLIVSGPQSHPVSNVANPISRRFKELRECT